MARNASASRPRNNRSPWSRMPSLFNTIRACLYGLILLFTVVCLAMAGQFQSKLAASDLTRFVPFAIFVCSASLFIFTILLAFSFLLRERNPISTRIELASLGLAGVFWLVLGAYLSTSESQDADVECFSSDNPQVLLDPESAGFETGQYQAMYRVLNAFSLMNAALVLLAGLVLLILALRRHQMGEKHMWHGPVTSCAWFNSYGNSKPSHKSKTSSSSILPFVAATNTPAAAKSNPHRSRQREYTSEQRPRAVPPPPPKKPERHASGRSGQSGSTSAGRSLMSEIDNGLMLHPNDHRR